jgi:hypothetical protein
MTTTPLVLISDKFHEKWHLDIGDIALKHN